MFPVITKLTKMQCEKKKSYFKITPETQLYSMKVG